MFLIEVMLRPDLLGYRYKQREDLILKYNFLFIFFSVKRNKNEEWVKFFFVPEKSSCIKLFRVNLCFVEGLEKLKIDLRSFKSKFSVRLKFFGGTSRKK